MTYTTPCARPDNDPDDWFIGKDGKQYPGDEFLDDDDLLAILEAVNAQELSGDARVAAIEKAQDRAEADAKRAALARRRHAKEACGECYLRTNCLDIAITRDDANHGTWGGYYEEELREIRREIARRKRKR